MLKRDGKIYIQIVKKCSVNELILILSEFDKLDESTIYSDYWKAYDGLVDYGAKAHYRVKHSKNEFTNSKNHINGIENFLVATSSCHYKQTGIRHKHRLAKFNRDKKREFLV